MANKVTVLPSTKSVELGGLKLELRLSGKAIIQIEKRLDESLMGLFLKKEGEMKLPPINALLIVLQGANTTSGITEKRIIEAFEKHYEDGGSTMDVFMMVNELMEESGFFGREENKENEGETLDRQAEEDTIL